MRYKKILLIDDDEDDCEIFVAAITEVSKISDYTTLNNAAIALQQLENKQLQPDLIFLDLNMPVMNGTQFLTEMKKRESLKDIPIIIFSTSSHPDIIKQSMALGAHDFITKPSDFKQIVNMFESIII